jgi:Tfp pilus assembly protein FimT
MAVLLILAFASALAVPAFRKFVEEDDMTKATRRIEALFRVARDSAVRSGWPVTVVIDSVSSKVWLDVAQPVSLDSAYAEPGVHAANRSVTMGSSRLRSGVAAADHVVEGEDLGLPESVSLEVTRARARFEFAPSGASFPDTLLLSWTMGQRMITVHRWTGDILVF